MMTDTHHSSAKALKVLLQKQGKESQPYFLVESEKVVMEAVHARAEIFCVFYEPYFLKHHKKSRLLEMCRGKRIRCEEMTEPAFRKISSLEHSDGVLAQVKKKKVDFPDIEKNKNSCVIVLDEIQDPGNMGTILRLCDAFGASAVFLGKGCASVYNPKVIRASMGAFFHLPFLSGETQVFLQWLKQNAYSIIVSDARGGKPVHAVSFSGRCALVFGNESRGLPSWISAAADVTACIPQHGKLNSINVANACSIFLYERSRQRALLKK